MIEQQLGFSLESFFTWYSRDCYGVGGCLPDELRSETGRLEIGGGGLFMQFVFALAVLYVPVVGIALEWVGKAFIKLMDFTQSGVAFLLGPLVTKSEGFIFC